MQVYVRMECVCVWQVGLGMTVHCLLVSSSVTMEHVRKAYVIVKKAGLVMTVVLKSVLIIAMKMGYVI
jgi:hypothetical protein